VWQKGLEHSPTAPIIVHFDAAVAKATVADAKVLERWARALMHRLNFYEVGGDKTQWREGWELTAWESFAGAHIRRSYLEREANKNRTQRSQVNGQQPSSEIEQTMDWATGALSLSSALRIRDSLPLGTLRHEKTVPFQSLLAPSLAKHPFESMLLNLGRVAPTEGMAKAVPAEFWYVRSKDLSTLFNVSEQFQTAGSPFLRLIGGSSMSRGLLERYETMLGLKRSEFTKVLGPTLIDTVALTGSDAYLKEGTDLTLLFEVKAVDAFRAAITLMTALRAKEHAGMERSEIAINGVNVTQTLSKDGAIYQFFAITGTVAIVSNSLGAITRVLNTVAGKHSSLADEADFKYMLARDADTHADLLVYLSDRFIAEVAGPRQRILESRRVRANSELLTPGLATMLHGYLQGRSPRTKNELFDSGTLKKVDLVHHDGAVIEFEPGQAPRSKYGIPSFLTPIIDLETPKTVSEAEAAAYANWSRQYENMWAGVIDPAMLRFAITEGKPKKLSVDLRVLPLLTDLKYNEFFDVVGDARVKADSVSDGVRMLFALSHDARWRRELNEMFQPDSLVKGLSLDILGDWALVGVKDDPAIIKVLRDADLSFEWCHVKTERNILNALGTLPLYAGVGIASYTGAAFAISALRQMGTSSLGDEFNWAVIGKEHGVPITRVQMGVNFGSRSKSGKPEPEFTIYFSLLKDAVYVAQNEATLRQLVDAHLGGRAPTPSNVNSNAPDQIILDLTPKRRGTIEKLILQSLIGISNRDSRIGGTYAEAIFRGIPELVANPERFAEMSQAYLGVILSTGLYEVNGFGPEGVTFSGGGTSIQPTMPTSAKSRSVMHSFFDGLIRARAAIAFDREGNATEPVTRSLHTRIDLEFDE
jgi:hypothetical protein